MSRISVHAPHHPRKTPSVEGPLTWEGICALFEGCADFAVKEQTPPGWKEPIRICWLEGMVRTERLNDYVLRPLAACRVPEGVTPGDYLETGGVWDQAVRRQESLEETASALVSGSCALFLPGAVLTCAVETEEKRSVSQPDNETEVKGAKDSFVESIRTNTSLLRRRLRTPHLKIQRHIIGRQTQTPVELIWIDGIVDPALPKRVAEKLADIDEDGVITTGELEEYLTEPRRTVFPRVLFTERPDRVCQGLLEGRVALVADGISMGCVLPGDVSQFLRAPQDRSYHWLAATALLMLRYLSLIVTLLMPGFYIAVATFHVELIPTQLAISIIASEQDVPFPTAMEVIGLLISFEILQEAGLRLPKTIGQSVSIIGGLVVGQAAVEAKIVSPAVVIVVAVAGITGFTVPNQDFSNALRLWRLLLSVFASMVGVFGLTMGGAFLVAHLAGLNDFGVPYLWPFSRAVELDTEDGPVLRQPLPEVKLRPAELHPGNRRRRW